MNKLTILQIGTAGTPVKRDGGVGGAERVLSCLDREFTRRGHHSIVAAPGDSDVHGRLLPTLEKCFRGGDDSQAYEEHYQKIVNFLLTPEGRKVDIIHDHPGRGFACSRAYFESRDDIERPILITNHGSELPGLREDRERLGALMRTHPIYLNAISRWQKEKLEAENRIRVIETIHHGIPIESFEYSGQPGEYLFLLGRICKQKGQHIAIEIAKKTGNRLVLGGSVEDKAYFDQEVSPHLDGKQISYVGLLNDSQKSTFYRNAKAFLMPLTGPETFSLVTAESLASGTPAIVFNYGAVGEIIEDGVSGYVIHPMIDKDHRLDLGSMTHRMINRVNCVGLIDRADCRKRIQDSFTLERQADNYVQLYRKLLAKK